jgi:ABC-type transport system involved in cytochrome bd biosynthesis fused ATPase/permease subunit
MNESLSLSSGKLNLFYCLNFVSLPLFTHLLFSKYKDVYEAPYVAIGDHVADGFGRKVAGFALMEVLNYGFDIYEDIIYPNLVQSLEMPILYKFFNKQFSDDGAINAEVSKQGTKYNIENIYLKGAESFSKLYLGKTIIGMRYSIGAATCFYRVYKYSEALRHLMPAPFDSKLALPLILLMTLSGTSYLSQYVSEYANNSHKNLHSARETLINSIRESSGSKARNVIANNMIDVVRNGIETSFRSKESISVNEKHIRSINSIITSGTSIAKKIFIFATFGKAVIANNHETQSFYSMINEVGDLGMHISNLMNLYLECKKFGQVRDFLQEGFKLLAEAAKTVNRQKALITQTDEAKLSITKVAVKIPGKDDISIERLEVGSGEICALVGNPAAGKSTILEAIQTGTGLQINETGGLTRTVDAKFYMTTQDQDIERIQDTTLLYKFLNPSKVAELELKSKNEDQEEYNKALEEAKKCVKEQLEKLGFDKKGDLVDQLDSRNNGIRLSGGQKRACALIRAINSGAKLIMLDEPFESLDAPTAQKFREFIKKEAEKGKAFLIIDHTDLENNPSVKGWYTRIYKVGESRVEQEISR